MNSGAAELTKLVASELDRPAPAGAGFLSDAIRERHGTCVAGVVFYGSCLRKQTQAGVLDFYVVVDSYRAAYRSRVLAWLNRALPPNVFYLEIESPVGTLRSKYAVISRGDFAAAATPASLRTGIWARFCQPAIAVYTRDATARAELIAAAGAAVQTALWHGLALLPERGDELTTRLDDLWQLTLRETYAVEMRPETPETIRSVYLAAPARFNAAARAGLDALAEAGRLRWRSEGEEIRVTLAAAERERSRRAWQRRKPRRKALYLVSLLKSAATFGDWLPYVVWKLERHSGERIELTPRQRRHPLLWGWPVLLRVLRRRVLK